MSAIHRMFGNIFHPAGRVMLVGRSANSTIATHGIGPPRFGLDPRTIMIKLTLVAIAVFLVATFPATWLLMLFIGNVSPDTGLGYWGTLPLGIMVSALLGGVSAVGATD